MHAAPKILMRHVTWPHTLISWYNLLYTKFDTTLASAIPDIIGATPKLNGSHNLIMPFSGWFYICGLGLSTINRPTAFEVSISTHDKDIWKVLQNVENRVV